MNPEEIPYSEGKNVFSKPATSPSRFLPFSPGCLRTARVCWSLAIRTDSSALLNSKKSGLKLFDNFYTSLLKSNIHGDPHALLLRDSESTVKLGCQYPQLLRFWRHVTAKLLLFLK